MDVFEVTTFSYIICTYCLFVAGQEFYVSYIPITATNQNALHIKKVEQLNFWERT